MTYAKRVKKYFEWLCSYVSTHRSNDPVKTHKKLLYFMFNYPFKWMIDKDSNRAGDGLSLRYEYAVDYDPGFDDVYTHECSVLEMMVALALRCERDFTGDPEIGLVVDKWFWNMIDNMGLTRCNDYAFDENKVSRKIDRMLYREYEPNGKGGLFIIKEPGADIRDIEIWSQMNWYISEYLSPSR